MIKENRFFFMVLMCGGKYMIWNRHLHFKLCINPFSKTNESFVLIITNLGSDFLLLIGKAFDLKITVLI